MARWEPNARERLQTAAIELFEDRGYDRTTVGDIASRAGLTERTFFRYFTDKREVLFSNSEEIEKLIVAAVASAPTTMSPLEVVAAALEAMSPLFEPLRPVARRRQALVSAHAELRERELMKATHLAGEVAARLRERGVESDAAALLAMTGMILFQSAFGRWIQDAERRDLAHFIRDSLAQLRQLTAGRGAQK